MKLGIVGHGQEKFTTKSEARARYEIFGAILKYDPSVIVSGHSPMGGVDIYAEEIALDLDIETDIYAPDTDQWNPEGGYGYMARNLDIAACSDLVLCVVVSKLPPSFGGRTHKVCYHCARHTHSHVDHVKSGGCWTAWKCERQEWIII